MSKFSLPKIPSQAKTNSRKEKFGSKKYFENMGFVKAYMFFNYADKIKKLPNTKEVALKAVRLNPLSAIDNFSKYENKKWAKKIAEIALKLKPKQLINFLKTNHKSNLAKRIVLETLPLVKQDELMNTYRNLLETNDPTYVEYIKKEVRENKKIALVLMTSIRYFAKKSWARDIIVEAIPNAASIIILNLEYFKDQDYAFEVLIKISDLTKNNTTEQIIEHCVNKEWAYALLKKEMPKSPKDTLFYLGYYKNKPWAPNLVMDTIDYSLQKNASISFYSIVRIVNNKPWFKDVIKLFLKHFPNDIIDNMYLLKKIKGIDKIAMKAALNKPESASIGIAGFAFLPNFEEIALYLLKKEPAKLIYYILRSKKINADSKLVIMTEAMKNLETILADESGLYLDKATNLTFKTFLNESTFKSLRTDDNLSKLIINDPDVLFANLELLTKNSPKLTIKLIESFANEFNGMSLSVIQTSKLKKIFKLKKFQQYSNKFLGIMLSISPKLLIESLKTHKNPGEILQLISSNLANVKDRADPLPAIYDVNGFNEIKLGIVLQMCETNVETVLDNINLIKERDPQNLAIVVEKIKKSLTTGNIHNEFISKLIDENRELFGEKFMKRKESVNKAAEDIISKNKQILTGNLKFIKNLYTLYKTKDKRFGITFLNQNLIKIPTNANVGKAIKNELNSTKNSIKNMKRKFLADPALTYVHQIDPQWIKKLHVPLIANQNKNELLFHVARNLWTTKKEITKENVAKEVIKIYKNLTKYSDKPIFKDRNIVYLAHNEKWKDGTERFGKKAALDGITKQGGKLDKKDFLRAKNTLKSLKAKKQAFLKFIENKPGPITAVLDAHGGPNAVYLSDGKIKGGKPRETKRTIKITYKEIAKRLIKRKKNFGKEKDDVLFIFKSCYSSTMIRNIYAEVKKLGGSRFVAVGTSEYNQFSYSEPNNKYGSDYYNEGMRFDKANKKNPTTFEDLFKANKERKVNSNPSIFIPSEEGEFRQIAEKQKKAKPDQLAA